MKYIQDFPYHFFSNDQQSWNLLNYLGFLGTLVTIFHLPFHLLKKAWTSCSYKTTGRICIFGLSKFLTRQENGSVKCITRQKFGSQMLSPNGNLAPKYHYQPGILLSNIITRQDLGSLIYIWDPNSLSGDDIWGNAFLRAIFLSCKQFWEPKNLTKILQWPISYDKGCSTMMMMKI